MSRVWITIGKIGRDCERLWASSRGHETVLKSDSVDDCTTL